MSYEFVDLCMLKTLISNRKRAVEFVSQYDTKLFSPDVWNYANIIIAHIKSYKDVPTLRILKEKLEKGGNQKLAENLEVFWKELENFDYDQREYIHDLEKIKNRYSEKEILNIKEKLSKVEEGKVNVKNNLLEINKMLRNISSLDNKKSYESKSIKEYLPTFVEKFNALRENPELDAGIKTKYSYFDFATNGVRPADFVLIAGESGFGKSLFLNNIAVQVWQQDNSINTVSDFTKGHDIIYFSLEMPYEDCFNRLLSRLSGVPSRSIEKAKLTKEEFRSIKRALDFIDKYPNKFKIVDIADASANDLESILIDSDENFDVIFVDYLGIMRTNTAEEEQDWLKQGKIAYELRAIARKYSIPMFSAVQLNRKTQSKDSGSNIGLSRLARSGTIATHATHVIQIENRENEEEYPDFIYHFIKNRKGPKGKGSLMKNLACTTLEDIPFEDSFSSNYVDDISTQMNDLDL